MVSSTASILKNDEYHDFETFRDFAVMTAQTMPEKTKPMRDLVAVAMYIEPQRSKSGLYIATKTQDESRWQANIGVIIAKGPTAFRYDGAFPWEGYVPEIGDVVAVNPSDSRGHNYRGLFVRVMGADLVKMVVDETDADSFY